MKAVSAAVLLNPALAKPDARQMTLDFKDPVADQETKVGNAYKEAIEKAEKLRNRFAQNKMLEELDIETDLKQTDEALGNPDAVEQFVKFAIGFLGGHCQPYKEGYRIQPGNLPVAVKALLPAKGFWSISFESPTPEGYYYIGRNHKLVEGLAQIVISGAFEHVPPQVARASLFRSDQVKTKTVLTILRVRNVMKRKKGTGEIVAEELVCWGYRNQPDSANNITHDEVNQLLKTIPVSQDINPAQRDQFLSKEIQTIKQNEERSLELTPGSATYMDTYAWVLFRLGRYADARTWIEKALSAGDADGVVVEHYGDNLFELGDKTAAMEQWRRAKSLSGASQLIDRKINEGIRVE